MESEGGGVVAVYSVDATGAFIGMFADVETNFPVLSSNTGPVTVQLGVIVPEHPLIVTWMVPSIALATALTSRASPRVELL
jgi:hypothetical protein